MCSSDLVDPFARLLTRVKTTPLTLTVLDRAVEAVLADLDATRCVTRRPLSGATKVPTSPTFIVCAAVGSTTTTEPTAIVGVIEAEVTMNGSHRSTKGTTVTEAKTASTRRAGMPTTMRAIQARLDAGGAPAGAGGAGATAGAGGAQPDGPRPGIDGPGAPGGRWLMSSPCEGTGQAASDRCIATRSPTRHANLECPSSDSNARGDVSFRPVPKSGRGALEHMAPPAAPRLFPCPRIATAGSPRFPAMTRPPR